MYKSVLFRLLHRSQEDDDVADFLPLVDAQGRFTGPWHDWFAEQRVLADRVIKWANSVADMYDKVWADGRHRQVPLLRSFLGGPARSGKSTTLKTKSYLRLACGRISCLRCAVHVWRSESERESVRVCVYVCAAIPTQQAWRAKVLRRRGLGVVQHKRRWPTAEPESLQIFWQARKRQARSAHRRGTTSRQARSAGRHVCLPFASNSYSQTAS